MRVFFFAGILASLSYYAGAFELEVNAPSEMHNLNSSAKTEVQANKKISINEQAPLWITSPGRIPVLVIPLNAQGSHIKIDSPRAEVVFKEEKELRIDSALSDVTLYMSEISRYIANRELPAAAQKLDELKTQYPEMRFLNFLDATIAFLSGDRDRARALVNLGLEAHPTYKPGLELKKKIEGGG